jgi:hypothetical protein
MAQCAQMPIIPACIPQIENCQYGTSYLISNFTFVTHHIKLGIKSHLECLELWSPAYSLHPKLHFDTNLIFVSLLVHEILAHFFCPSGKLFLEKIKGLCQDFHYFYHYMMQQNLLKLINSRSVCRA